VNDISQVLRDLERGESKAADDLIPLVYEELRHLAAYRLAQEKPGQTLQATALVHEAYLRLLNAEDPHWNNHRHFFHAAAEAMRRILIDKARRKQRIKHNPGEERIDLDRVELAVQPPSDDLLALNEALTDLEETDPEAAKLVKLRFFGGLTMNQAAEVLRISERAAYELWSFARAWLYRRVNQA
jgi:RNA polymerase sigma factor (TIGR02999 family)